MTTRKRNRHDVLLRLSDAAIDLFTEQGAGATIDAIAHRAGVSRRTVFRYVEQKEELAYIHPVLWFDVFEAALIEVAGAPLLSRLATASRAIAQHIDAAPEAPRRAFAVVATDPRAFDRGFARVYRQWIDRIAAEVLSELSEPDAADRFRARIVGAAVMGMVDAVTREWVAAPPGAKFVNLYDDGFRLLAPVIAVAESVDARHRE